MDYQKITLIQSQADRTVNPKQAVILYRALKNKNKNVELFPYPGEDHTFIKTNDIEGICRNIFSAVSIPLSTNCNFH